MERAVVRVLEEARAAGLAGLAGLAALPGTAVSVAVSVRGAGVVRVRRGTPAGDDGEPLGAGTLFDLASLTKVFVAVAALSIAQDGLVGLDDPVSELLPVGSGAGAGRITLRHLLTHTAGLPPSSTLWREESEPERLLERALATPLDAAPGGHEYSCLGYVAAGRVLEIATGTPLDVLVERRVLDPLGAMTARFGPVAAREAVATEAQPGRGVVRGEVHDELAHGLARPVGNAGLFGTADDVLALGELLRGGGDRGAARVLHPDWMPLLREPAVVDGGAVVGRGAVVGGGDDRSRYGQAVGLRVADRDFMGGVDGVGHTGFTGTSLVVDPQRRTVTVLLMNAVHPSREGVDLRPLRRRLADAVAASVDGTAGGGA
ncbi:serine hydrolase [Cellulomonas fimi]|uniref:Beta-lactamase family protein n=1 Tax=Cellulomonas fimi TaxID=1708 RepID=A0A7Y0LVE8_CELFI|nr:serine hydrolase domain-containing protein [Cellulomonas fimi]NMR18665.1 beta-lactamase family protein [Cellulomonas fimi]